MEEPTTASAIISFAEKLESNSSKFYETMTEKHPKGREMFLAFVKESKKNKVLVTRTIRRPSLMPSKHVSHLEA